MRKSISFSFDKKISDAVKKKTGVVDLWKDIF
jgi:hypothetical protein